jgi:[acyl-carrier-protein] S-malonyltransferase
LLIGEQPKGRPATASAAATSNKVAFLFPGQGAQTVGMCKELVEEVPAAKELFSKASEILGYDLLDRCVNGPKESLDSTAVSQPAIFTASMAALEKLKQDEGDAVLDEATVAMGLSLGEYSALCFAGAISFEDGVRVTKARGEAMQAAADAVSSSMVSIIGLDSEKTGELCKKASELSGKSVQIANYLCKGNYTVSGDKEACAKVVEIAKPDFKARMAVPLAVAGAFHTDFMAPAVDELKKVLSEVDIKTPRIPVISNVDCEAHGKPEDIRKTLAKQVTSPVLWETQMQNMVAGGFEKGYELGPGKVIAGIVKRIDKKAAGSITNITA